MAKNKKSGAIRKHAKNAPRKYQEGRQKGRPLPGAPKAAPIAVNANRETVNYAHVKCKAKRQKLVGKIHTEKKDAKAARRRDKLAARERGEAGEHTEDGWTRTIEGTREADETIVPPEDEEVIQDDAQDEFAEYFDGSRKPKLMLTTSASRPCRDLYEFLKEIKFVIPNSFYYPRKHFHLKKIIEFAKKEEFTDLLVFSEKADKPHGVYMVRLPEGPTSYWRLTSLKRAVDIKGGATLNVDHEPELIMNNFSTRLGRRSGRQLAALFPQKPNFRGRRVICFHNQRDFVFFRHYRYIFRKEGTKTALQEIGPRFTLKMRYMQHGTFDSKTGQYEWVWRPDSNVNRTQMAF